MWNHYLDRNLWQTYYRFIELQFFMLLLSYSTILAKEGGQESVEELCTLINILSEKEEEASLLWTAFHSLLTDDKEEKEDLLAWLQASPRFEAIPLQHFSTETF